MKQLYRKLSACSFILSLLFYAFSAQGQTMSGTKTIGGAGADYATINAAVLALTTSVVTGPVTFKIRPGTYNEKIAIPRITSASATKTVTFTSENGNAADVVITNATTSSPTRLNSYTIYLNGTNYMIFKDLTIQNTGTTAGSCFLLNNECVFNTITECILKMDTTITSTPDLNCLQSYNQAMGSVGNNFNASFNTITGNTIIGGSYGIRLQGASVANLPHDAGNIIRDNTVLKSYNTGIHAEYNDLEEVSGNKVIPRASAPASTGIYITESDTDFSVTRNYIRGATNDGIVISNSLGITRILFANNMVICNIKQNYGAGISVLSSNKVRTYHNSVLILGNEPTSTAVHYTKSTIITNITTYDNSIVNNIFSNMAGGYIHYWSDETNVGLTQCDYNVLYTVGNSVGKCGDDSYNLAGFKTATGKETNSIAIDPVFFSDLDLHTVNPLMDSTGTAVADVTTDYDGQTRNATKPDMGADEFVITGVDIALADCSPEILGIGNNVINVTLRNTGIKSLKDSIISLSYSIDNGTTWSAPESYQIKALPGFNTYETYTFSNSVNITVKQAYELCVRINGQGLVSDLNKTNELVCKSLCVGLRGTYTVGGTSPDFPLLRDAIDSLASCGAGGPVIFNIRPGTYTGRTIIPEIKGTNTIHTVTIRSETGNREDVILKGVPDYDPASFAILKLLGSDHFIIENMTILEVDNSNYSACVQLGEGADHNTIRNCVMLTDTVKCGFAGVFGILFSENQDFNPVGATRAAWNLIENNVIVGGIDAIGLYGQGSTIQSPGNIVRNNTIRQCCKNGIFMRNQSGFEVSGNYIRFRQNNAAEYGIDLNNVSDFTVDGNYVYGAGYSGIHMQDAISSASSLVSNNMIAGGFKGSFVRAVSCFDCTKLDILHNTVITDKNAGGNSVLGFVGTNDDVRVLNNVFYNKVSGYVYDLQDTSGITIDHNLVYTDGKYARWSYYEKNTLADLQAVDMDVNSSSFIPVFRSDTDLHVPNTALAGLAPYLPEVPKDIDGDFRSQAAVFLGADEFLKFDLQAIEVLPKVAKSGPNTVSLTLINRGFGNLKDSVIKLSYSTDNGVTWSSPQSFTIKDLTGLNTSETFNFSQVWTVGSPGTYNLCARIEPPGFQFDPNKDNDLICTDVCIGSSGGTFTVGGFGADFPTLSAAVNSLSLGCGIGGPYVFNIRPGVYLERLSIPILNGTSAQNTVTFRSETGNAADVTIVSAGGHTATDHHTIRLAGAKHIIFSDLTIRNGADDYASAIHFIAGASDNLVERCIIETDSTGPVAEFIYGITGESLPLSNLRNSSNRILNNHISGGYHAISWQGNESKPDENNEFLNNLITSSYSSGINLNGQADFILNKNRILMRNDNENSSGILISNCKGNAEISGNYTAHTGSFGMQVDGFQAQDSALFTNNMIAGGFSATNFGNGIYVLNSSNLNFYHNSIHYDKNGTPISAAFYVETSDNLRVANNIFNNKGSGYAYYADAGGMILYSDYNDLYTNGTVLAYWGQDANDLVTLRTLSGMDVNTVSVAPGYFSDYNLHVLNTQLDGKGLFLSAVPFDYDGQQRHTLSPDIGADEFSIGKDGGVVVLVQPTGTVIVNTARAVKITVSNYGNIALSNFPVSYSINGGSPVSETVTGTLAIGGTIDYEFTGKWTPSATGNYQVCSRTVISGDIDNTNDEICTTIEVANAPDAALLSFSSPVGPVTVGSSVSVKVAVKNEGDIAISNFPVVLLINGVPVATDNFLPTLAPGAISEHTFSQPFEPSATGAYQLKAYASLSGDLNSSNDTIVTDVNVVPVGVQESAVPAFKIFPNPVRSDLTLRFGQIPGENSRVLIYTELGQLVTERDVKGMEQMKINTGNWTNGIYLLQLQTPSGIINQRFVLLN